MHSSMDRTFSGPATGLRPAVARTGRLWFWRPQSRLARVLERNARWAAEARYTPPLHDQDAA
jgi:hypothetical protein